jgi:hypothetical protein
LDGASEFLFKEYILKNNKRIKLEPANDFQAHRALGTGQAQPEHYLQSPEHQGGQQRIHHLGSTAGSFRLRPEAIQGHGGEPPKWRYQVRTQGLFSVYT